MNAVAREITEFLSGARDCDMLPLLRRARDEIVQLDYAARLATTRIEQVAAGGCAPPIVICEDGASCGTEKS